MSRVVRFFLVVALSLAGSAQLRAQISAQDQASNYSSGWKNGANGGSGFLAWLLEDNNSTPVSDDYSGFFLSTSGTAALDTVDESFGLYANGPDYNEAVAWRSLRAAMSVGQVFEVKFKNNSIATGGAAGISLFPTGRTAATNTLEDITSNACLSVYFVGRDDDYYLADGNGVIDTGIPWNENGMLLEIALLSETNYFIMIRGADGTSSQAVFVNEPFLNAGLPQGFVVYALDTGVNGNVFFNQLEVASASVIPPVLLNVTPSAGAEFLDPASADVSFQVVSPFSGVSTNEITLTLNGVAQSNGLAFAGSPANWIVNTTIPLQTNITYTGAISVTDSNGNTTSQPLSFNTWSHGLQFIEAEDYNFHGGNFIPNPVPDEYGAAEDGLGALSTNAIAMLGVDAFKPSPPDGGTNVYRPQDSGRVDVNMNDDVPRPIYAAQGLPDYSLVSVKTNEWENYTRVFSNVVCVAYARMLPVSGAPVISLEQLAAATATNSSQTGSILGAFVCPVNSTSYTNVPLTDSFGNPIVFQLNGTNTLRVTCAGGTYDLNYLVFLPASQLVLEISNPILRAAGFTFNFQVPGTHTNSVQFKNQLTDAVWQTLTNIPSFGGQVTVTDAVATNSGRFYRVVAN
ncbi:MAG TPA: hypothetical protein VH595_19190 [Verrucomicrobiae bacterium]|jgi:hypothetical protein|nr:hypothetical protein [Verrucomicrobiae bacterium]